MTDLSLITLPERWSLQETADHLGVKRQTCRKWRHYGTGPRSYLIGNRVFYDAEDVRAWVAAEKSRTARGGNA